MQIKKGKYSLYPSYKTELKGGTHDNMLRIKLQL